MDSLEDNSEDRKAEIPVLDNKFTQEELERAWREYAHTEEDTHLKNTILNIIPQLLENNHVLISVFNPDQQNKLHEKAIDIQNFLFQKLQNNQLRLDIQITENKKEFIPYSNRDKFDYMVEKNPTLLKLVKDFNLRLD